MLKHTSNANGQPPTTNGQLRANMNTTNTSNCNNNNNNNTSTTTTNNNNNNNNATAASMTLATTTTRTATPNPTTVTQSSLNGSMLPLTPQQQQQQQQQQTLPTTTSSTTSRSIHLRPQQPLNISTLSATSLLAGAGTTPGTATSTPATTTTPLTPLTPNGVLGNSTATAATMNGNCNSNNNNNMHTYTNQHMLAAAAAASTIVANGNIPGGNATGTTSGATTMLPPPLPPIKHLALLQQQQQQKQHQQQQQQNHQHHSNYGHTNNTNSNNNKNITNPNTNNNNYSNCQNLTGVLINQSKHGPGPREALTSLGLLCLVSLLLALLSLIFLLKISPNGREEAISRSPSEDFVIVYDVTLALCALSLSLNLCCLLVCSIQFLFAVKLVRSPMFDGRDNKYLEKSSASRTCAVGGFFISIPIFLTGIILYTFNHFHSTPAIITSVLIGIGIVFCGGAMVHNVFVWQKEKTISYRSAPVNMSMISHVGPIAPPAQFLNSTAHSTNFHCNHGAGHTSAIPATQTHLLQQQQQQLHQHNAHYPTYSLHPTSVTPVSPNHSHGSFNALLTSVVGNGGGLSSSYIMRPSTATPPTPKPMANGCLAHIGREASGSVSPGIPGALDMSNITSPSLHELSTLV